MINTAYLAFFDRYLNYNVSFSCTYWKQHLQGFVFLSMTVISEFNCCIFTLLTIIMITGMSGSIFPVLFNATCLYIIVDFSTFLFPLLWYLLLVYTSLKIMLYFYSFGYYLSVSICILDLLFLHTSILLSRALLPSYFYTFKLIIFMGTVTIIINFYIFNILALWTCLTMSLLTSPSWFWFSFYTSHFLFTWSAKFGNNWSLPEIIFILTLGK